MIFRIIPGSGFLLGWWWTIEDAMCLWVGFVVEFRATLSIFFNLHLRQIWRVSTTSTVQTPRKLHFSFRFSGFIYFKNTCSSQVQCISSFSSNSARADCSKNLRLLIWNVWFGLLKNFFSFRLWIFSRFFHWMSVGQVYLLFQLFSNVSCDHW